MMRQIQRAVSGQALVLTVLTGCAWLGCSSGRIAAPPDRPGVIALIVDVGQSLWPRDINRPDQVLQLFIKKNETDCGAVYIVTAETVIGVRRPDGSVKPGVLDDLVLGETVEIWALNPILLSCPGLGTADWVHVIR